MAGQNICVLLVEDNPVYTRLIQRLLGRSEHPTFDVLHAGSIADALQRLATSGIDVILLDLVLPDSTGVDSFYRVRAQANDTPIIVQSALDDVGTASKAVEGGAQDYLLKDSI